MKAWQSPKGKLRQRQPADSNSKGSPINRLWLSPGRTSRLSAGSEGQALSLFVDHGSRYIPEVQDDADSFKPAPDIGAARDPETRKVIKLCG